MGAPDLLQWFCRDGFELTLLPSGGLAVSPASKLTDAHRNALREHKEEIVKALVEPSKLPGNAFDREAFEERAAIMEHDGGMSRTDAEAHATACMVSDVDRHCWPHTEAMNTAEIDTFNGRLHLFTRHGLDFTKAETLADSLIKRDRDGDDRRLCLECRHLQHGIGLWGCNHWRRAGLAVSGVPAEVVTLLQRCEGFTS